MTNKDSIESRIRTTVPLFIQSQSPISPYSCVFEDDGEQGTFFAVSNSTSDTPLIEDQVQVYQSEKGIAQKEAKILWNV